MNKLKKIINKLEEFIKNKTNKKELILDIQDYFKDITQDKLNSEDQKEIKILINSHSVLMKKKLYELDYAYLDYYINGTPKYYCHLEINKEKCTLKELTNIIKTILDSKILKEKRNINELLATLEMYQLECPESNIITTSEKDLEIKIEFSFESELYLRILGSKKSNKKITLISEQLSNNDIHSHL